MSRELSQRVEIEISKCKYYENNGKTAAPTAAPIVPAPVHTSDSPVGAHRSLTELADVAARLKAITKDKKGEEMAKDVVCSACGKTVHAEDSVTDICSGKVYCQSCYDNL